jgi:hypothetical protein
MVQCEADCLSCGMARKWNFKWDSPTSHIMRVGRPVILWLAI